MDNAQHAAHNGRAARQQEAQRIRNAQDPLAYQLLRKHILYHQCRALPEVSLELLLYIPRKGRTLGRRLRLQLVIVSWTSR